MRKFVLIVLSLLLTISVFAQEKGHDEVFIIVEEMPEFPGGDEGLRTFIANTVKYPEDAHKNGIQGKVYVKFVVDKDGSVDDAKIARGVDPSLDKEALRVINALPKWKPGKQRGEAVRVEYTVPIKFALKGDSSEEQKTSNGTDTDQIFFIVEDMPEFPGGDDALKKYIANSLSYPEDAHKNGIQGKVYVSFVVEKDGSVGEAKIERGVDPSLDKEALRVVKALPQWKPGKQRGKAVRVKYTVPINFALN
ncbi:energy transducer TonB [Draconibacterium sp. IB214405]|uniref:energy transducer TonB n=1 Tax=Draconibacterium sp. IB214405 TaxID=3097352 RepID=UPI002A0D6265|nr:energy transducer TonB [Draconibacterium sp. IB214405]MDX8339564.1 energy transducer TonB [Draconibacterium sp. IB214405]